MSSEATQKEAEVHYCQRCGSQMSMQERLGRLRPVCPQCDWIYFPDPKVAAAVLVEHGGRILLVRRTMEPERGKWTLPAGFVDAGEDPARAAERECLEETGLKVKANRMIDMLYGLEHPRGAHIIIFYQADIVSGALTPGDDVDGVDFFPPDQLPPLAFHTTLKILDQLKIQGK